MAIKAYFFLFLNFFKLKFADWKSLTISACLPLTTDFLPDPKSMENDYLDSEYALIPEFQCSDLYARRCYKDEDHHNHNSLRTDQVFQELICQRLQQGFQVVLNPNFQILQLQSSTPLQANTPNMSKTDNLELKAKKLNIADLSDRFCVMSIGRIFHRLELDNSTDHSTVKIKISRPKDLTLNNNIKMHYCYRFRAPDSEQYIVSWVDFVTESLENYNWSYLDNYICLRGGEDEYELRENLKFWRLRMLLLPSMQQQTKQILDNISVSGFNCDIYSRISQQESNKLIKGFLKFFSIINKIKNQTKSGTSSNNPVANFDQLPRRFSATFANSLNRNNSVDATTFRDRINSVNYERSTKRVGLMLNDKQFANDDLIEIEFRNSVENLDNLENNIKKINGSSLASIIDAMKTQFNRFQFLPKQGNLPNYLFTSADAVQWAIQSIENITNEEKALNLFTKLLENRLICHASGQQDYPFKYGFFLYYIVVKGQKLIDDRVDLEMYKREWFEVEISNSTINNSNQQPTTPVPEQPQKKPLGLKNPLPKLFTPAGSHKKIEPNANNKQTTRGTDYYKSVLDTDFGPKSKSNRAEWLHIKYQQTYNPTQAFELVLEWMVSTGNQIAEIVQNWARRSTGISLSLMILRKAFVYLIILFL